MHVSCSKSANFERRLTLLTDLPIGINKRFPVGAKFFILGTTQDGHAHITHQARIVKIRKSECEGRRDFIFSLK